MKTNTLGYHLADEGVTFTIRGVTFDFFVSDSGAIGFTLENEDGHWGDVFIDPKTIAVSGDTAGVDTEGFK